MWPIICFSSMPDCKRHCRHFASVYFSGMLIRCVYISIQVLRPDATIRCHRSWKQESRKLWRTSTRPALLLSIATDKWAGFTPRVSVWTLQTMTHSQCGTRAVRWSHWTTRLEVWSMGVWELDSNTVIELLYMCNNVTISPTLPP